MFSFCFLPVLFGDEALLDLTELAGEFVLLDLMFACWGDMFNGLSPYSGVTDMQGFTEGKIFLYSISCASEPVRLALWLSDLVEWAGEAALLDL